MKARFKLPMNSELAAQYLTAAISAEVEYRNHPFRNGNELHKQVQLLSTGFVACLARTVCCLLVVAAMAKQPLSMPCKTSSIILASRIKRQVRTSASASTMPKTLPTSAKRIPKIGGHSWTRTSWQQMTLVPSLAKSSNTAMCSVPSSTSSPTAMNTNCRLSSPPTSPLNKSQRCTASVSVTD